MHAASKRGSVYILCTYIEIYKRCSVYILCIYIGYTRCQITDTDVYICTEYTRKNIQQTTSEYTASVAARIFYAYIYVRIYTLSRERRIYMHRSIRVICIYIRQRAYSMHIYTSEYTRLLRILSLETYIYA